MGRGGKGESCPSVKGSLFAPHLGTQSGVSEPSSLKFQSAPVLTSGHSLDHREAVRFSSSATWWLICCHQRPTELRTLGGPAALRRGGPQLSFFPAGALGKPKTPLV